MDILIFPCFYIFSLTLLLLKHFNNFHTNSSVHEINTRCKYQLQRPVVNLSCYQRGVYYSGITLFSSLPSAIYNLKNTKSHFRAALQSSLALYSLYYVKEFSAYIKNTNWYLCLLIYLYVCIYSFNSKNWWCEFIVLNVFRINDCLNAFQMWIVFCTYMVYMYFFWQVTYPTINMGIYLQGSCIVCLLSHTSRYHHNM